MMIRKTHTHIYISARHMEKEVVKPREASRVGRPFFFFFFSLFL